MSATSAVVTLLSDGLQAITNAITSGQPIQISKWEIGTLAAAAVPADTVSALPSINYAGSASAVLLEQENGLAVFNIVLNESVGDFYAGNIALKIIDPVTQAEVLLAVIMFPTTLYKVKSESNGGAVGETGNYYLVKLVLKLSSMQALATVTLSNTVFSVLPSVADLQELADPSNTTYPQQIMLRAPETGSPALVARRPGDNVMWGFGLSWPIDAHNFGIVSGGYQGDWYGTNIVDTLFGGYFYLDDGDYDEVISGGTNWVGGNNINTINGGSWG